MQTRTNNILAIVIVAAVALSWASGCAKVDAGTGGVLWTAFSGTQDDNFVEGWYFVAPWNKMFTYNVRTQDKPEQLHVLANNGLSIGLETSVRYRADPTKLSELHTTLGPDYYNVVMAPALRSEARKVGGRYTPEEIYSTKRAEVEKEIFEEVKNSLEGRPIILEAILVRNVDLPDKLKRAINDKLEEEQRALKMRFTLNRATEEAKRKEIEAKGIADRNRIITESITDKLLRYEGIQATERLAISNNAKIVVIGSGKDGMPLILGQ
ncbi:MAG: prohibitin family protein [Deltaproteobacteria bacterium]|nr:prohibitin family protein [Deltaproteobacteria bacterium]